MVYQSMPKMWASNTFSATNFQMNMKLTNTNTHTHIIFTLIRSVCNHLANWCALFACNIQIEFDTHNVYIWNRNVFKVHSAPKTILPQIMVFVFLSNSIYLDFTAFICFYLFLSHPTQFICLSLFHSYLHSCV